MLNFAQFIAEATSVDDEMLGHLTHTKDLPHEAPQHTKTSIDLLHQFHQLRQGKKSTVGASLKTDGGASIHIIHDEHGVGVSDKHRMARGVIARTPAEIDQHFGHAPGYAASLKHVLAHGASLVNKGHHVQGDLLHTPDSPAKKTTKGASMTPNRITYHAQTKAPLGVALHTEVTKGVAHGLTPQAVKSTPHIFTPTHEYHADPATYSHEDRAAVEHHLGAAKALLKGHTTAHLTPEHIGDGKTAGHFTTYLNRTTRRGETASVEGYKKHLAGERDKAASKLKTPAAQMRVHQRFNDTIAHVDQHAEHFNRSLQIRHHLGQATEHLLKGVAHPDMETSIDGKKSQGEGIVLQKKDSEGRMRPVSKLVPVKVSNAILNNPRFGRG
jgi:hypothetical protein